MTLDRRDILAAAAMFGTALALPLQRALAAPMTGAGFTPSHEALTAPQRALVAAISERIVPTTDTPGAVAAGVPEFVELMLADWYAPKDRDQFLAGIAGIDAHAQFRFSRAFAQVTAEEQDEILTSAINGTLSNNGVTLPRGFFEQCRQLVILGYYTSEIGCKQERIYVPVPGGYDGHYPKGDKVFSS